MFVLVSRMAECDLAAATVGPLGPIGVGVAEGAETLGMARLALLVRNRQEVCVSTPVFLVTCRASDVLGIDRGFRNQLMNGKTAYIGVVRRSQSDRFSQLFANGPRQIVRGEREVFRDAVTVAIDTKLIRLGF